MCGHTDRVRQADTDPVKQTGYSRSGLRGVNNTKRWLHLKVCIFLDYYVVYRADSPVSTLTLTVSNSGINQ